MGQITRTNFGLTKTRVLTNAEVKSLPTLNATTQGLILVEGIPNVILVPMAAFFRHDWFTDYGNIDATATLSLYVHGNGMVVLTEAFSQISDLLAGGQGEGSYIPALGRVDASKLSGFVFYDNNTIGEPIRIAATNGALGAFTGTNALDTVSMTVYYCAIPTI